MRLKEVLSKMKIVGLEPGTQQRSLALEGRYQQRPEDLSGPTQMLLLRGPYFRGDTLS